jgi:hypothetical protein
MSTTISASFPNISKTEQSLASVTFNNYVFVVIDDQYFKHMLVLVELKTQAHSKYQGK